MKALVHIKDVTDDAPINMFEGSDSWCAYCLKGKLRNRDNE
jgi:hypothetical protein